MTRDYAAEAAERIRDACDDGGESYSGTAHIAEANEMAAIIRDTHASFYEIARVVCALWNSADSVDGAADFSAAIDALRELLPEAKP